MFDSLGEDCTKRNAPRVEKLNKCTGLPTINGTAELVVDSLPAPTAFPATNRPEANNEDNTTNSIVTHAQLINKGLPLPPYTIYNTVRMSRMYDNTYMLLVYNPKRDLFYILHSKWHYWVRGVPEANEQLWDN